MMVGVDMRSQKCSNVQKRNVSFARCFICICTALVFTLNCADTKPQVQAEVRTIPDNLKIAPVDPTVICVENFEGWGLSLCWWANIVGHWPEKYRKEISRLAFGEEYLNFNIARYNIGASPDPNTDTDMRPGGAVPCFTSEPGKYDWTKDSAQRLVLLDAKRMGANIFEAFSNSPPWWMTWTGDAGGQAGSGFCGPNMRPEFEDAYAEFLVEVVKHFRNSWGVTFRTVEPFNEPNSGSWCEHNNQEGCNFPTDQQDRVICKLGKRLKDNHLQTVVAAPDTCAVREAIDNYRNKYGQEARDYIGQINTHTYSPQDDVTLSAIACNDGKRLWMSEFGLGQGDCQSMDGSISLAQHITSDMYNLCPAAWVSWQPIGFGGCGGNWGFVVVPWEPGKEKWYFTRQGFTFQNYSKFIRPGARIILGGYNKTLAAYHPQNKTLTLVVWNELEKDYSFVFDLSKFVKTGSYAEIYRTSQNEDFMTLPSLAITNKKLLAEAKARSVTTYFIENVDDGLPNSVFVVDDRVQKGPICFKYHGLWQSCTLCGNDLYAFSNTWNAITDDYATVEFVGSQVDLFGVCDPGHGIAGVSVDGGKETDIDLYAKTRTGTTNIFEKKWSRSGRHTIKIRVTGRKNPEAGSCTVAVDKIAVFR